MAYHNKTNYKRTGLASVAALAMGAVLAFAPMKAEAATIRIEDLSGGGTTLTFGTAGTQAQTSTTTTTFADGTNDMTFVVTTTPNDHGNLSELNTISVTTEGAGSIRITTSETGFGAGADAPRFSKLAFAITSSRIGDEILAKGFVDSANGSEAQTDQIGSDLMLEGPVGPGTAVASTTDTAVLFDPFSITSVFEITHDQGTDRTSFDADIVATVVPLPASALLLLGGLGGLGGLSALRRRKRAA